MMKVANPIYDIVFKYLLEDERIASDAKIRHSAGMSAESIAMNLNLDLEKVNQIIKDK